MFKPFLRVLLFSALIATGQRPQDAADSYKQLPTIVLPGEFNRVLRDYENAWSSRDAKALANLFVEDGFVLSPGSPIVRGRRAIEEHYRTAGGALSLRAVAYSRDGSLGYIIGGFSTKAGTQDRGKFSLTLKQDLSGKWLIISDMDNGNIEKPECP